jgi:hypothetical protein
LESLVDDVVEDVDKGLLGQAIAHFIELEFEGGEPFGDEGAQRVRFLLVLLEGGDELLVEAEWTGGYGLSEERSKPSFEMSVLFSSNFPPFYFSCGSINLSL